MASTYIIQQAKIHNKSEEELTKKFKEAKKIAIEAGKKDNDYDYITKVFQKLVAESVDDFIDQVTFKQFLVDNVEDIDSIC
jgi:ribosomal 50S subunit-associated protein YjgA (DUF615 family)